MKLNGYIAPRWPQVDHFLQRHISNYTGSTGFRVVDTSARGESRRATMQRLLKQALYQQTSPVLWAQFCGPSFVGPVLWA